jgi:hypothetical protein
MIKLKSLLLEAQETPDSDQWDNWQEYLDYFEYDIEKGEIAKIIKNFGLKGKGYFDNRIVKIFAQEPVYLEYDPKGETFSLIKDINQWVWDNTESGFVDPETIYNGWQEASLKDIRANPGKVYHYTTPEKYELIRHSGQVVGSYGTGLTNRGAHGIFTSTDPQEYALGSYGEICLELNLEAFKQESSLPELNLEFEPDVLEYLTREYLAHTLEIELRDDLPSDMSPYTVIVNHIIPVRFVRSLS